ncbi:MAG: cupin domain-containing protein [Actinomycetota bacterium]
MSAEHPNPRHPTPVSVDEAWASLAFLPDRTPTTTSAGWAAVATPYRDGGMFLAHYAGSSAWERHPVGDEIVMVTEGATTMTMFIDGAEVPYEMGAGQLIVVPQNTWHRFDSPDGVKVATITPQPTEHFREPGLPPEGPVQR